MSVETCPQAVDCECDDFPLLNRTQDENDPPIFIGECVACGTLIGDDPPLGRVFQARGCQSWVTSTVSQAVANALAAAQEAACNEGGDDGGNPVPPVPWTPTPFTPLQQFANEEQGVSCAGGQDLVAYIALPSNLSITGPTLTVAAGSFTAPTQQAANALAATYVSDFMSDGLDTGDLECVDPWVFSDFHCGDALALPPGVTATGFSADTNPTGCAASTTCGEGFPIDWFDWAFEASRTIGPFVEDKLITLTGTYQVTRFPVFVPECGTQHGVAEIFISLSNLVGYTGHVLKRVDNTTGTSDSGVLSISGTLPAGLVTTVLLTTLANSVPSIPVSSAIFDITVVDA